MKKPVKPKLDAKPTVAAGQVYKTLVVQGDFAIIDRELFDKASGISIAVENGNYHKQQTIIIDFEARDNNTINLDYKSQLDAFDTEMSNYRQSLKQYMQDWRLYQRLKKKFGEK
jgi:hypothetical protein